MNIEKIHNVYFIGIGGIGMSALARYFLYMNKNIAGYDRNVSDLTRQLEHEGCLIHYEDDPSKIPEQFLDTTSTLIVYTPAISSNNKEFQFFQNNGFYIDKRSAVLGLITEHKNTIAVAGTHGKTSVSTMTAHILDANRGNCAAFLGGIAKYYNSNFIFSDPAEDIIVEADEYDRSFLQLTPGIAIITAIDQDHLDIYQDQNSINEAFSQFVQNISPNGILIYKKAYEDKIYKRSDLQSFSYSIDSRADFYMENLTVEEGEYVFTLHTPYETIENLAFPFPGRINLENALAALAACRLMNISVSAIIKTLQSFSGVKRRFDIQLKTDSFVFIDDYAHHPTELRACISSVKELYPKSKITGIFQPHLYSRTKDFAYEFAKSLELLDELILLDIYPAREAPIPGISSELIYKQVQMNNKQLCNKDELLEFISQKNIEVLLTLGAGDISELVEPIRDKLIERLHTKNSK